MYNSESIIELNKDYILARVTEEQIFRKYCPVNFELNTAFCSPLREDTKPSFSIYEGLNGIRYKDFATGESGSCFDFVTKIVNTEGFFNTLKRIANDFGLFNYKLNPLALASIVHKDKIRKLTRKRISIKVRKWSKNDAEFWLQYHIPCKLLVTYNIVPVENYWINDKEDNDILVYRYNKTNPCYSFEFGSGVRKLYCPYSRDFKWINNTNSGVYSGLYQLDKTGKVLVVTKSMKDVLVWKVLGFNAVAPQTEASELNSDVIKDIKERFNKVYINFDNDSTGKEWSKINAEKYGLEELFMPEEDNIKDISDYIKKKDMKKLKELINNMIDVSF